ncbi:MAG: 4Fe-4S dicluster domain-containing protein [Bacillota bacterium]
MAGLLRTMWREYGTPSAGFTLDKLLNHADQHLSQIPDLIPPAPESKPRTPFDSTPPIKQGPLGQFTPKQKLRALTKMMPLMISMERASGFYRKGFNPTRNLASPALIAKLEAMARELGVKDIGYVKVPHNAIFRDKGIPCEYAILFTVEMDKEPISTAPSAECKLEVMDGYKRLSLTANRLTRFLRRQGFAAYPGTALGGLTDYVHLAELAGLGAIGYHGLLISPGEGARLRINTIYTNISNLPTLEQLGKQNEHLWVRDFCAMCKKCIRQCPVSAIYSQPKPRGDGGMQAIDHDTCRIYFSNNFGCGVCLAVCPFSQAGYEKVKASFKGNDNAPQFRIPIAPIADTESRPVDVKIEEERR